MAFRSLIGAIIAALALSCGDSRASGQQTGRFEATVTIDGTTPIQLSGFARSEGSAAHQGWNTHLITPGGGSSILFFYSGAARPPTGEHVINHFVANDATPLRGQFLATGSVDPQLLIVSGFHSVSGTIIISASTPTSVEGTFSYRANGSDGRPVTVEGNFQTVNREF